MTNLTHLTPGQARRVRELQDIQRLKAAQEAALKVRDSNALDPRDLFQGDDYRSDSWAVSRSALAELFQALGIPAREEE